MAIPHGALVLVADGKKMLFLRNQGDEGIIDLRTEATTSATTARTGRSRPTRRARRARAPAMAATRWRRPTSTSRTRTAG